MTIDWNELRRQRLDEIAWEYGAVCDVVERAYQRLPFADNKEDLILTSGIARRGANLIFEILGVSMDPDDRLETPPKTPPATRAGVLLAADHVADWWADGGACDALSVGDDHIPGLLDHLDTLTAAVRAYRDHNTTEEP